MATQFVFHAVVFLALMMNLASKGNGEPLVPCYFIFGASYYDNGNNNRLLTTATANYFPYGIDYPQGPTGRFTNGRTAADFLAEYLGFDHHIPPFPNVSGNNGDIQKGVNYASGSSGILEETGKHVGARICMDEQLQNHKTIISRIVEILGDKNLAANKLHKCLYSVAMGDNDYINNYFKPKIYDSSSKYSPERFANFLLRKYHQQLMTLYREGARKIVLFEIPPLDCSPEANQEEPEDSSSSGCVKRRTHAINLFNTGLKPLVENLNKNLTDAKFVLVNTYGISRSSVSSFKVTNAACCKVDMKIGIRFPICIPGSLPCENRKDYLWYDQLHQTEAAYKIIAERSFKNQSLHDTYPIDITSLVQS